MARKVVQYVNLAKDKLAWLNTSGRWWARWFETSGTFKSTIETGTAPIEVDSTTKVENLNVDMIDGLHIPSIVNEAEKVLAVNIDATALEWVVPGTSGTPDHNDLAGLQGGTTDEYYHLTEIAHNYLTPEFGDASWIYVSKTGSDTNTGTEESPFLTIQHAVDSIKKNRVTNITIDIGVGTYNETVLISGFYGTGEVYIRGSIDFTEPIITEIDVYDNNVNFIDIYNLQMDTLTLISNTSNVYIHDSIINGTGCYDTDAFFFRNLLSNGVGLLNCVAKFINNEPGSTGGFTCGDGAVLVTDLNTPRMTLPMSEELILLGRNTSLYVSPTGDDDNNDGNYATPLQTIGMAKQFAVNNRIEDLTIYLLPGEYTEDVYFNGGDTPLDLSMNCNVTIMSYSSVTTLNGRIFGAYIKSLSILNITIASTTIGAAPIETSGIDNVYMYGCTATINLDDVGNELIVPMVYAYDCNEVEVMNCYIENMSRAIESVGISRVHSVSWAPGSSVIDSPIMASSGAIVTIEDNQPTSTVENVADVGGVIINQGVYYPASTVPNVTNPQDLLIGNTTGDAWETISLSNVKDLIDKHYNHQQISSAQSWVITHNLNKYPSVRVFNGYSEEVIGDIVYDSINQVTINFVSPFSGRAFLN